MPIMIFMTRYYHSSSHSCRSESANQHNFSLIALILLALITIIVSSCEEGATKIGSGLLPGSDFVGIKSTDTLSVWSYTNYDESVRTESPSVSHMGQIYDPYFGTTTTEFVTQIRLGGEWKAKTFHIDSVKLYLQLINVKGNASVIPTLKLSEIAMDLYTDSAYYSNTDVLLTGYEVPDLPLNGLKPDTINYITIDLPVSFGEYLTRDTSMLFYSNTRPDFRSYFKGLYFQLNSGADPYLVSLSLAPPSSVGAYNNIIALYMHDDDNVISDYYFVLDAYNRNASFNRVSHDFTTASPDKKIEHINDGFRDTLSYLQSLNGTYCKISFPGLAQLKADLGDYRIAVNKARLSIPVFYDGDIYKPSTVPGYLYLRYLTKDGSKYLVPDFNIDQDHAFFDGKIDTLANIYNFNIPTFFQKYLEDKSDEILPELEVFQSGNLNNVILKSNSNKTPVKFSFTYTKF